MRITTRGLTGAVVALAALAGAAGGLTAQSAPGLPGDLKALVGPGAAYDAARTRADADAARLTLETFGLTEVDGMTYRFWVFRHPGSFDDAVAGLRAPGGHRLPAPTSTDAVGDGVIMFAELMDEMAGAIFGDAWLARVEAEAPALNGRTQRSLSFEMREPGDDALASAPAGTPVRYVKLDVTAPFLDVADLAFVDGTYLHLLEVTYPFDPSAVAEDEDDDWWGEDEGDAPTADDLGVPLYPGAVFTPDAEYVYELASGETGTFRTADAPADVTEFYKRRSGRHCRADVAEHGDGFPMHELVCLTHPGDETEGDDVVRITIYALDPEQREALAGELGEPVPAGTTIIAVDRYEEGAW